MAVRIMSTRREEPKQSPENRMERIGATVRRRALSGSEASSVGFTLVVYIFAGAGLGYLLDKNLETSYWIAIGMLFGTVVGFREMFRLTNKLTKSSALEDDEPFPQPRASSSQPSSHISNAMETSVAPVIEPGVEEHAKPRLFSIPAPPQASFDRKTVPAPTVSTPEPSDETQEEFTARLLESDTPKESP